jgi:2'-5' RNA ligase
MKRLEKRKLDYHRDPKLSRLFVALQPPLELRRELSKNNGIFNKEMRNLKFIEQDQLHLTLKFLGDEVSPDSKDRIIELLNDISLQLYAPVVRVLDLRFGFPKQMTPSILFYNIEATKSMQILTELVHEQIMNLDLPDVKREKDYKKLVYHMTIGRLKHNSNRAYGRKIRGIINEKALRIDKEFIPDTIYLLKSKLERGTDPRYEVLAQFRLRLPKVEIESTEDGSK